MAGAYPSVAPFRCYNIGQSPGLTCRHYNGLVRPARDKPWAQADFFCGIGDERKNASLKTFAPRSSRWEEMTRASSPVSSSAPATQSSSPSASPTRWWCMKSGNTKGEVSMYHWPPVWLVWISLFWNKNKNCQLSYSWFQISLTGGQQYSDTSPFIIPCWNSLSGGGVRRTM